MLGWIGLGSNLGDSANLLRSALRVLDSRPDCRLLAVSPFYRSPALTLPGDHTAQPDYCNAVAALETQLSPQHLLAALLQIENQHGRKRSDSQRWQPRSLDLDLLALGDCHCDSEGLRLPHAQLHKRGFVLQPWADIAPTTIIPGHGTVAACLARLHAAPLENWPQSIDLS